MHASTPHAGKTKEMRLAVAARYVPTSVELYGNMKETNIVYELGGNYSLDSYGAVLVSGRNEYTDNRIRAHTTRGKAFVNSNPR
jgi:non-heme Fe2+,alpha-ketoglutarate-dependent halogenase